MKKFGGKRWHLRDVTLFSVSLLVTLAVFGSGMLYFFSGYFGIEPIKNTDDTPDKTILPRKTLLLCLADAGVCYEAYLDFHRVEAGVRRLYLELSHFEKGGLSELQKAAERSGSEYDGALVFTETQWASVIDYVGGVTCDVDKRISTICGGITLGYGNIAGVAAIRIYAEEKENELLCLNLTEEIVNKWCLILSEKRSFFRLLDISTNNLSYVDYLPLLEYFKRFKN